MSSILSTAVSGLAAQTKRLEVSAGNIVNSRGTGVEPGAAPRAGEYLPRQVALKSLAGGGVQAIAVPVDPASVKAYEPGAPGADANGFVNRPNVQLERELITQIDALRSYQANLAVIRAEDRRLGDLLDLIS
jgi:flagellar basal-body rod protein FlgC